MAFNLNIFNKRNAQDTEISILFPLSVPINKFIEWYIKHIYTRILYDCRRKSLGLEDKHNNVFFDSFVSTEMPNGLVSLVAKAMYDKSKLHLVYKADVVSVATPEEQKEIDDKIKDKRKLKNEIVIDFKNLDITDLLKLYAGMLYNALKTANVGMNITQNVILKFENYRGLISKATSDDAQAQAQIVARSIKAGKGAALDSKDIVEIPTFDIAPMEQTVIFVNGQSANAVGMPLSYINGALTTGISTTGEADELAVDRGLSYFFYSIFKPIVDNLLGVNIKFKSDNWHKLAAVSNLIPIIEGSSIIAEDKKTLLIEELFS